MIHDTSYDNSKLLTRQLTTPYTPIHHPRLTQQPTRSRLIRQLIILRLTRPVTAQPIPFLSFSFDHFSKHGVLDF
jgi:hypothetical protein